MLLKQWMPNPKGQYPSVHLLKIQPNMHLRYSGKVKAGLYLGGFSSDNHARNPPEILLEVDYGHAACARS
jgi:hypothetical protein